MQEAFLLKSCTFKTYMLDVLWDYGYTLLEDTIHYALESVSLGIYRNFPFFLWKHFS